MNSLDWLGVVLAAVYMTECAAWARHSTWAYLYLARRWWFRAPGGRVLASARGRVVFGNPVPPFGHLFFVPLAPICYSPEAIAAMPPVQDEPLGGEARAVRIDAVNAIEARATTLWLNGEFFAECADGVQAEELAEFLMRLKKTDPARRERLIRHELRGRFALGRARRRLRVAMGRTTTLAVLCHMLFFYLILTLVACFRHVDVTLQELVFWLVGLFGLTGMIIATAMWARRKLRLPATDALKVNLLMVLWPLSAIRAGYLLLRNLLRGFSPHLLLLFLNDRTARDAGVAQACRHLKYPLLPEHADEPLRHTIAWHNALYLEYLETAWRTQGCDGPEACDPWAAPQRETSATLTYCPRCHGQYLHASGECRDCPGLGLIPFASEPA